jgi:hypothetical protein
MVAKGYLIHAGIVAREYTVGYTLELSPEVIGYMYWCPGVLGTTKLILLDSLLQERYNGPAVRPEVSHRSS